MPNRANNAQFSATTASAESGIPKRTILYAIKTGRLKAELVDGLGYVIRRTEFQKFLVRRNDRDQASA